MVNKFLIENIFYIGALAAAMFGACFGSFAGVIISRIPIEKSIVSPWSHCENCLSFLSWWQNIPIISFIFLRGKCFVCKHKISIRLVFVEFLCALAAFTFFVKFGFSVALFERFFFLCLLLCVLYIDIDTYTFPLGLLIALFILGGFTTIYYSIYPDSYIAPANWFSFFYLNIFEDFSVTNRLLGAIVGGASFALVNLIATYILRKAKRLSAKDWAMGWGDPLLLAALSLFVGFNRLVALIFLSSSLGSIVGIGLRLAPPSLVNETEKKGILPYGPFLALAALFLYLF